MESAFTAGPTASNRFLGNPSSLGFLNGAELSVVELPFTGEPSNRVGAFSTGDKPAQTGDFDKRCRELLGRLMV